MTHLNIPKTSDSTQRKDPRNTRDQLVRAALELFATRGYHESTTPLIARRAGVAEGTIYRHFSSKEQLLNEIYRGAVRFFTEFARGTKTGAPCREQMDDVAHKWIQVATQDPSLVRLVFVTPPHSLIDAQSERVNRELVDALGKILASGKSAGSVRAGPVELWAEVWLQMIRLILQRVSKKDWARDQPAIQQVLTSAWDAIAAPPNDASR